MSDQKEKQKEPTIFRILFLKNDSVNSMDSFIDTMAYSSIEAAAKVGLNDAANWIVERHIRGERWTAEIVQVLSKIERTGGTPILTKREQLAQEGGQFAKEAAEIEAEKGGKNPGE